MGASKLPNGVTVRDELGERPTEGSGPVHRARQPSLPCDGCGHAPVCRIRPRLAEEHFEEVRSPDPAVRVVLTIECDHFLASQPTVPLEVQVRPVAAKAITETIAGRAEEAARRRESQRRGGEVNRARVHARRAEVEKRRADVLAAVERHGRDIPAIAAELGLRPNAVAMVLKFAAPKAATEPLEATA